MDWWNARTLGNNEQMHTSRGVEKPEKPGPCHIVQVREEWHGFGQYLEQGASKRHMVLAKIVMFQLSNEVFRLYNENINRT